MGLRGKLKKAGRAISNLDEAGKAFGRTLVKEVRKDVARKGSTGQRFADAPLGQFYLPKKAQSALSFVAPSPRKVVRDVSNVRRNPSPGNIAANVSNAVSIATLPLAGAGAVKGAKGVGRAATVASRAARAGRIARAGESGMLKFPSRGSAIQRVKGRVMNTIRAAGSPMDARSRDLLENKIPAVQAEIRRLDAAEALHKASPTSLKNLSDIRSKMTGVPKGQALQRVLKAGEEGWIRTQRTPTKVFRRGEGFVPLGTDFSAVFGPGRTPKAFQGDFEKTWKIAGRVLSAKGIPGANKVPLGRITGTIESGVADIQGLERAGKYNVLKSKEIESLTRFAKAKGAKEVTFRAAGETRAGIGAAGKPIGEGAARHKLFGKAIAEKGMANLRAGFLKGEEGFMRLPGGKGDDAAREVVRRANLKATRAQLRGVVADVKQQLSMETETVVRATKAGLQASAAGKNKNAVKMMSNLASRELRQRAAMRGIGMTPGKVVRQQGSIIDIEGRMPLKSSLQRFAAPETARLDAAQVSPDVFNRMTQSAGIEKAKKWANEQTSSWMRSQLKQTKKLVTHPGRMSRN